MIECRNCGQHIRREDGSGVVLTFEVWVDDTGGDVCCADKFLENNENVAHQPKEEQMIEITTNTADLLIDVLRDYIFKLTGDERSDSATHPIEMALLDLLIGKRMEVK